MMKNHGADRLIGFDFVGITPYSVIMYNSGTAAMAAKRKRPSVLPCPPKPALQHRALIGPEQAAELMGLFKALANDTRLRMLHALARSEKLSVTQLADALGMKPQAVSNQLQRLLDRGILGFRRNGSNVYYRIVDPCVTALLDQGLCLTEDARARRP